MSDELNEKIDKLLTGFGKFKMAMEKQMDNFDKRLNSIEEELQQIFNKLLEHDKRFDKLESRMGTIYKFSSQNRIDIEDLKDEIKDKPDYRVSE